MKKGRAPRRHRVLACASFDDVRQPLVEGLFGFVAAYREVIDRNLARCRSGAPLENLG